MEHLSSHHSQVVNVQRPKYFVDISGTLEHSKRSDFLTGIQRVVVTVAAQLATKLPPEQLYLSWCDKETKTYHCLRYDALSKDTGILTAPILRRHFFPELAVQDLDSLLGKYSKRPLKRRYHIARLDLLARRGDERSFKKRGTTLKEWAELRAKMKQAADLRKSGQPFADIYAPGDHVLQLDLAVQDWQMRILAELGQLEVMKHLLIYDLIPLDVPQVVSGDAARNFLSWLDEAVNHVDAFLVISEFSHTKLKEYLEKTGRPGRITTLPLAQDRLPLPNTSKDEDDDPVSRQMAELYPLASRLHGKGHEETELFCRPFVICVGTIEARKNIWRIAMAWKQLVEEGERDGKREIPTLVFVGNTSHMPKDFKQFMEGTGGCHGYIRIVSGPSDDFLELLYQHCLFSVQVSLAEGWGLPVGESLAYGRTALVGRASSLPEVGGDLVEYCDTEDIDSIADAARRLLDADHRAALEARISEATLRSWSDVADDLLRFVEADKVQVARLPQQQPSQQ
ncbi:glycosyltransferase [Ruegeria sp. HKCCD6228]|uniref:glycosyltransferase n=1 Tax=unclassified Ruegeria TaxID=2625375 RepID=UPI001487F0A3|nr:MULTISPECIES: glycosyltransferase [unclassified Ruegeria]NOD99478.1 glycosyltransferase [Ruegeria sp. HKCCD6228]